MEEIVVFDFDKTLTNYDTTLPFFIYCCKKKPFRYLLLPIFLTIKVLSKLKVIKVKREKEIGLKFFCSKNYENFQKISSDFSKRIVLNDIYNVNFKKIQSKNNQKIIIATASFKDYLTYLFPNTTIIGTTLKIDKKEKIKGIELHPFEKEKAQILQSKGYVPISLFFTDSKIDLPTASLSQKTIWVNKGKIIHQQ